MFRRMLASLLGSLKVRIELAGLELQDEIDHLIRAIAMAIGGALLLCIGLALVAAAVVVALWETHRVMALAGFALLFTAGGALTLWQLARVSRERAPMFADTAEQFELDLQRLTGNASATSDGSSLPTGEAGRRGTTSAPATPARSGG
jgi:uncharacterized membrane protein YqjE